MAEALNCPRCHALYIPNAFFAYCFNCVKEEEVLYQKTYEFLRKRENRAATTEQVYRAVGVSEKILHDWVRKGRLRIAMFPNLSYPCDRCGALIQKNKLCVKCKDDIEKELQIHEMQSAVVEASQKTYYALKDE